MADYNKAQQFALAFFPKITGLCSCLFSLFVIVTIIRTDNRSFRAYHRLVLGISISDLSSSFSLALSTWPIPRDSGVLWASGNDAICTTQGFFNHLGVIATFYNVSLNLYFLLVVRYGWKDAKIHKIEPLLHGIPLGWGFATAIYAAGRGLFGNALLWCWIRSVYDTERWILYYAPLTVNIFLMMVTSLMMYLHVRKVERKTNLYKSFRRFARSDVEANSTQPVTQQSNSKQHQDTTVTDGTDNDPAVSEGESGARRTRQAPQRSSASFKQTRTVGRRCLWFSVGFFLNWTALYVSSVKTTERRNLQNLQVTRLLQTITGKVYYPLLLAAAISIPLQGIPNGLVYLYPKYQTIRHRHRDWTRPQAVLAVLSGKSSSSSSSSRNSGNRRSIRNSTI